MHECGHACVAHLNITVWPKSELKSATRGTFTCLDVRVRGRECVHAQVCVYVSVNVCARACVCVRVRVPVCVRARKYANAKANAGQGEKQMQ